MRRLVIAATAAVALGVPVGAAADPADYAANPGLAQASACGQYHGAFQYYSGTQGTPVFWIPEAAQQGGIGDTTGPANSAKGCQGST